MTISLTSGPVNRQKRVATTGNDLAKMGHNMLRPYEEALRLYQGIVHVRATVAEKLPGFADLRNHVEVEVGSEDFVFIA